MVRIGAITPGALDSGEGWKRTQRKCPQLIRRFAEMRVVAKFGLTVQALKFESAERSACNHTRKINKNEIK